MKLLSKAAAVCVVVIAASVFAVAATRTAAAKTNAFPATDQLGGSRIGPGSPGWNQLDTWMQNVILNGPGFWWGQRKRNRHLASSPSRIGPGSPGWEQLEPWMQNVVLNGPGYAWGK